MMRLLLRLFSWRHARLAPGSTLLLVLILAVGVAAYFSVRLANRAAQTGFAQFSGLLSTQSDWVITPPAGHLDAAVLTELRTALRDLPVHLLPVLETTGTPPRPPGAEAELGAGRVTFSIIGLDFAAVRAATAGSDAAGLQLSLPDALHERAVFITPALAARESLQPGAVFPLIVDDAVVEFRIAGVLPEQRVALPDTLLFMQLGKLQTLTRREGRLDRVEFLVPEGPQKETQRADVRRVLDDLAAGRWHTASPNERRDSVETMTRAFRLNLTLLSLLALLVGLYLIYQALDGAVVRRREEIGILRSLGVTASAIRRAWMMEAALLGLAGGVLGALMGWGAAQWAVVAVGRTVNALYHAASAQSANLHAGEFIAAVVLGCGAGVIAGWLPARDAALTPPAQILRRGAVASTSLRRGRKTGPLPGLALLAIAAAAVLLPPLRFADGGRIPAGGYLSVLCALLGGGLLCGPALQLTARMLRGAAERSAPLRIAVSHLRSATSRHRTAAAGLLCATAMTTGMAIMISSFDLTMMTWIHRTLAGDLFISSDGAQSASTQNRIAAATWQNVCRLPGAGAANVIHALPVVLEGKPTLLAAGSLDFTRQHDTLTWALAPESADIFDEAKSAALCVVSEAFGVRYLLTRGDSFDLPTPAGPQRLRIAGVFSDYGNERGTIVIERGHFIRWFADDRAASIVLHCAPGHDPAAVRAEILRQHPGLTVFTNQTLREQIVKVFKQSFLVTWALEIIGVIVAVAGVGLSLASMMIERRTELASLRALGMTQRETARASALEGAGIALGGLLPGLLLSTAIGWLLIHVINRQTFGWTLQFTIPWWQLGAFAVLILASATAAGWWSGRRAARLPADREE